MSESLKDIIRYDINLAERRNQEMKKYINEIEDKFHKSPGIMLKLSNQMNNFIKIIKANIFTRQELINELRVLDNKSACDSDAQSIVDQLNELDEKDAAAADICSAMLGEQII